MDTKQKMREKADQEAKQIRPESNSRHELEESHQLNPPQEPPPLASSPTNEFSFTISLHQPSAATSPGKSKASSSIAVDLSPADEIFFHGHLLPLHLLSHLPVSPRRSSNNSLHSFTLPIKEEITEDETKSKSFSYGNPDHQSNVAESKKSKSLSVFGISRWRGRGLISGERERGEMREKQKQQQQQRKTSSSKWRFHVSQVLKRYMRMARPLFLSFRGRRERVELRRQPYSFSDDLMSLKGRWGEFRSSAPASVCTSPGNRGLLAAGPTDSTVEELQAAIQAAIAHCKNSFAMEEKIKCQ